MSSGLPTLAIIGGTGALGRGLARRWAAAGYPIVIGSRTPEKAASAVAAIKPGKGAPSARGMDNASAARCGSVVVITVPYANHAAILVEIKDGIASKIVVDATVPLVPPKVATVQLPPEGSVAVGTQKFFGESARVVSAFQNVAAYKLHDGKPIDCDVLVCGNDKEARDTVIGLVTALGLRGIDAGPLANSVVAETLTSILIGINRRYKVDGAGIRITGRFGSAAGTDG